MWKNKNNEIIGSFGEWKVLEVIWREHTTINLIIFLEMVKYEAPSIDVREQNLNLYQCKCIKQINFAES